METIKFFKVNALPSVLEPNSVYLVNTDGNLSIYVSNNTGSSSIKLTNSGLMDTGLIPYPVRKETPKVVGDIVANPLTGAALITRRLYIIPFITPRVINLTGLRINVIVASTGSVSLGIYSNTKLDNGNDNPHELLVSGTTDSNSAGDKTALIDFIIKPNTLYWFGLMASSAPTLRSINISSVYPSLGRIPNNTNASTHLYSDYAVFGLPSIAPANLSNGLTRVPCIYLIEQ